MPLRRGIAGDQRGLPDVLDEAAPLPSEVAIDGGMLTARRREALAELRGLLLDRPRDIDPEDWRVCVATLAPPAAHLPRSPGTAAKSMGVMQAALECFPGYSPTHALRKFREAQERPVVKRFLADFRALELADVQEQRGMVREALHATIVRGTAALYRLDPEAQEWAKVSACVTAACKVLTDMDALALRPDDFPKADADEQDETAGGVAEVVRAKIGAVAADLRRRKAVDVVAEEVG